ncbi:MAG: hypothetical protein ABFS03_12930, partial [Chloroflexota bacterium]
GEVKGTASSHATAVENTCVSCHLENHAFEASLASCQDCHEGIEDFDLNGAQTEIEELADELGEYLKAAGLLDEEGHPVKGTYPEDQAQAAWNYIYIVLEDKSMGLHNTAYAKALLEAGLAVFK